MYFATFLGGALISSFGTKKCQNPQQQQQQQQEQQLELL
jgi:hypothetical protein